jgi:malonyl-CoA O-methyltransferase
MQSPFKQLVASAFNKAAPTYAEYAKIQHQVTQLLTDSLTPHLFSNATMLDLGCGTGFLGKLLLPLYPSFHYQLYQLDIAYNMCKESYFPAYHTIQADIEHLPFAPGSLDIITASMSLQWVENLTETFKDINALLKPGGIFFGMLIGDGSFGELIHCFNKAGLSAPINSFPSLAQLNDALHKANISNVTVQVVPLQSFFPDLLTLLKDFKRIGAHHLKDIERSALTKTRLSYIEHYYREDFIRPNGQLPITWNIYKVYWVTQHQQ